MHDFDYHDTINTESYGKYFETICKHLKPNSVVIIIDNACYHSRNAEDFLCQNGEKHSFNHGQQKIKYPLNQMLYDQSCGRFAKYIEWIKHQNY